MRREIFEPGSSPAVRALVGCERSGTVRRRLRAMGIDAWSCDIEPADDGDPHHFQTDVRNVLSLGWHLAVFHPPCTYLTVAGLHWNKRDPERAQRTEDALDFVRELLAAPIPHIALENPVSCIGTRIRKADQSVQPYQFGDDAAKRTCFWLQNLPVLPIDPAARFSGRMVIDPKSGKLVERWSNQLDTGQNRLSPSPDRARLRSETYGGIGDAIAATWGGHVLALYGAKVQA